MSAVFVWLTGRRGAGKQTVGAAAAEALRAGGPPCALLDADALTTHLAHGPTDGGLASLAWLGRLLTENDVTTIVTVDMPRRADRDELRAEVPGYVEVYVQAQPDVALERAGFAEPGY